MAEAIMNGRGLDGPRPRSVWPWLGLVAALLLPWFGTPDGLLAFAWLTHPFASQNPTLLDAVIGGAWWWLPMPVLFVLSAALDTTDRAGTERAKGLIGASGAGLALLILAIVVEPYLAPADADGRPAMIAIGLGTFIAGFCFIAILARGLAQRGVMTGDAFVIGSILFVVALVAVLILYPLSEVFQAAIVDRDGALRSTAILNRVTSDAVWGLGCLWGTAPQCGSAVNSLFLAIVVGCTSTLLGLSFALLVSRTTLPGRRSLRMLTLLPIVTPPFVVGLALILLFGRSGTVTQFVADLLNVRPTRWVYGFPGLVLAQTLAFTPLSFLVLIGVVQGVSPSMEEAAQTLRASRRQAFMTVTLPLIRPGLASAFLLAFIESLADFGNPIVIGGGYRVLSTEIFFAITGAQFDQGRAAVLGLLLLSFTLTAFCLQRYWVGNRSYVTVTGKGDGGAPLTLPRSLAIPIAAIALPWAFITLVIYGVILFGAFTEIWGRDHSLTLRHFVTAFNVALTDHGIVWAGGAWNSFWTTLWVSALAAPLTAAVGLLTAYILARRRFRLRGAFDFLTMLSFATPGTVIGLSYVMAFNTPPIEMTGTALILILSFLSRNMPVGIRAGMAAMAQIDRSLDEASLTLGASTLTTLRRVIMPLLRPALVAALVYSFVSAVTAVSAIVFLASARYHWATHYIIGQVENGRYGIAVAYCAVLIVLLIAVVGLIQWAVGGVRIRRRPAAIVTG
ncbi:MAG: iron ABC transporter permease [Pseudomonadota bacterium]